MITTGFLRIGDWWSYKVPPLLAIAYLLLRLHGVALSSGGPTVLIFLISVIGTAGFGHLLNDLTDMDEDSRAGKSNVMARLAPGLRVPVLVLLLAASLAPWLWLPVGGFNFALLLGLVALFGLYSVPPARLKERHAWGVLADALYGHALPNLITGITFSLFAPSLDGWHLAFLGSLFGWKLMQGLCGAIVSQIRDRKNDRRSGARTFVIVFGPRRALNLVNRVLLPAQFLLFLVVCGVTSVRVPWFGALYGIFFAATAWKVHHRWKKPLSVYSRSYMGYAYLNDFSELWMPLGLLIDLTVAMPQYAMLLIAHCAFLTPLPAVLGRLFSGGRTG